MFGNRPKERQKLFDMFISEFNTKCGKNLKLSEDKKSEFVNSLLSKYDPKVHNKGKFISTFYYPRIVNICDIKKNRDIEISTPIPISMEESLQDFYKEFIENFDYERIYNFNSNNVFNKVFPLTFTGKNITFQVTKIEPYEGREYRSNKACIVYFKPENENITIQATFCGDDLKYPYFITLNGNKYEVEENGPVHKNNKKKKSEIENDLNYFQTFKQDLENYRKNLINNDYLENKYGIPKENLSEINNEINNDLNFEIEKLKKQLEDINTVISEDNKKIEELRDAIQNLTIEDKIEKSHLKDFFEEKKKIKESQKKLLYFQFIQNLSNYYYGKKNKDISGKIEKLVSILGYSPLDDRYPDTLVPSLTDQLKYLIKKQLIPQTSPQENSIQLASMSTFVNNVRNNQLQLSNLNNNLNNIGRIFLNIRKYQYFTFALNPIFRDFNEQKVELNNIERYFQENYQ